MEIIEYETFYNEENKGEHYIYSDFIGGGSYGKVYACYKQEKHTERFAIKIVEVKRNDRKKLKREVETMKNLKSHPNVINLINYNEYPSYLVMLLPLMHGSLDNLIPENGLSERECIKLFKQLILGVQYLHYERICHRDIKPENIFYTNERGKLILKIGDFGLSKVLFWKNTLCGSPPYMAPETWSGYYNNKVDMWSLGVVLYEMYTGELPFEIVEPYCKPLDSYDYELPNTISESGRDIFRKMLSVNSELRWSATDILKHDWFKPIIILSSAIVFIIICLLAFIILYYNITSTNTSTKKFFNFEYPYHDDPYDLHASTSYFATFSTKMSF